MDANYAITYSTGTMTVGTASMTITADNQVSTYGQNLPALTGSILGLVNGDTAASLASPPACTTTATAASPVGNYPITCSGAADSNYVITYTAGTMAVAASPLTISANDEGTTFGQTLPTLTASYSGLVNGDTSASLATPPICSTAATSASPPGTYPITCSGAADANYGITYTAGTLTVGARTLTVTANDQSSTYGQPLPSLTASIVGFTIGDSSASLTTAPTCSTTATAASSAGTYPIVCSGAVDTNYAITYAKGTMTIDAQALTIAADNHDSTYGQALPTLTVSYSGLVNSDTSASFTTPPNCSTTATAASPVGTYPITCSGAVNTNYSITYAAGTLTVDTAPLTITAADQGTTFGQTLPTLTASYSGLVKGDTAASFATPPACSTTATAASPVGTYPITCSGAVDTNYSITYRSGTLTVRTAGLTITPVNETVAFGTPVPAPTFTVTGVEPADSLSTALLAAPVCSVTGSHSAVGTYPIICTGGVADTNYSISYGSGTLTVTGLLLPVTVTGTLTSAGVATFDYSQPAAPPAGITGVSGTLSRCTTSASPSVPGSFSGTIAGCTGLAAAGSNAGGYTVTYIDGGMRVLPAPVVVPATQRSYWTVAADGGVFAYGSAQFYGSTGGRPLASPVVGMAPTRDGHGYWLVAGDGGVFAFGDAGFFGSMGGTALAAPIVSITATPDGLGYWLVARDGGVFAFGDAGFFGSGASAGLSKPFAGMTSTPDGRGYWLVGTAGGVFAFGDAAASGSMANQGLNASVVGIADTGDGHGYWLDATDGGVFAFGDAGFHGSMGGTALVQPMVGMSATADGGGILAGSQ